MGYVIEAIKRDRVTLILFSAAIGFSLIMGVLIFSMNRQTSSDQYSIEGNNNAPSVLSDNYRPVRPDLYVPTWLPATPGGNSSDGNYTSIESLPRDRTGAYIISFAEPDENGRLKMPTLSPALKNLIASHKQKGGKLALAIGGYGADEKENKQLLANWKRTMQQPELFAQDVVAVANELGLSQVDLDMEYPDRSQKDQFTNLVRVLHAELPLTVIVSVAVPADDTEKYGYDLSQDGLQKYVTTFNIMTYDNAGKWSAKAGDLAPAAWVQQRVDAWVDMVGDESKISVGYPAYCYQFIGAKARGDKFSATKSLAYNDLINRGIEVKDDLRRSVSYAVEGDWISCQSPLIMGKIHAKLRQKYPDLGGAFFWHAGGVTPEHIQALQ